MNEITNILLEDVIRERRESELFQSDENDQSSSHVEKENMTLLTSAGPNNEITKIVCNERNIIKISKSVFYNYQFITEVSLDGNKLNKISKNFLNFQNLSVLKLNSNELSSIPVWINKLTNLKILSLEHNHIDFFPLNLTKVKNLEYLNLSFNKINKIPFEIENLSSLSELSIRCNRMDELPNSIGTMKKLTQIYIEWFDFIFDEDKSPFTYSANFLKQKNMFNIVNNSSNISYIAVPFLKAEQSNEIQNDSNSFFFHIKLFKEILATRLLTKNDLYSSFTTILTDYNKKYKENATNTLKIDSPYIKEHKTLLTSDQLFYCIKMNYIGIIKAYIKYDSNFYKIKDKNNKTLLYFALSLSLYDMTSLLLNATNEDTIQNIHIYVIKTIKLMDISIFKLFFSKIKNDFIYSNSDLNFNNMFHILFNSFNNDIFTAYQIGEILIKNTSCDPNGKNKLGWSPIHIAVKRGKVESLFFIYKCNEYLRKQGREVFNVNKRGKEKWTPLHLAVNDYKITESIFLIKKLKCDIFIRNQMGFTPRDVADGNYLLSRFLMKEEFKFYYQRYWLNKSIDFEIIKTKKTKNNSKNLHLGYYKLYVLCFAKSNNICYIENEMKEVLKDFYNDEDFSDNIDAKIEFITAICDFMVLYNLRGIINILEKIKINYKKYFLIYFTIENALKLMSLMRDSQKFTFNMYHSNSINFNTKVIDKLPQYQFMKTKPIYKKSL